MLTDIQVEFLRGLRDRRVQAFIDCGEALDHSNFKQWEAEVTTPHDVEYMNYILKTLPQEVRMFVELRTDLWSEFRTGIRCSVCGKTEKQNKDENYDCIKNC